MNIVRNKLNINPNMSNIVQESVIKKKNLKTLIKWIFHSAYNNVYIHRNRK